MIKIHTHQIMIEWRLFFSIKCVPVQIVGGILYDFVAVTAQIVGHLHHLLMMNVALIFDGGKIHHFSQFIGYVHFAVQSMKCYIHYTAQFALAVHGSVDLRQPTPMHMMSKCWHPNFPLQLE